MKRILGKNVQRVVLTFVIILLSLISSGKTYYVSNNGSDSNSGLSETAAWKTLSKVNSVTLAAGDNVLFRRGDTFYGSLIPLKSGSSTLPVIYGAYGTGDKPVISGFETITGWTSYGNGIYYASTTASSSCNMVTVNGVNTPMGRYPKSGWLTFESYSGTTSITDNQLASSPSWTGAEVVIKKSNWILDRGAITSHSGTTITYTSGSSYTPEGTGNFSYFLQKSLNCLTQLGDWFCDGTNIYMYFGTNTPSNYTVKASIIDRLINISSKNYLVFDNLNIQGANTNGYYESASNNTIKNCDFTFMGDKAIETNYSSNITIDGCALSQGNGIALYIIASGFSVKNNSITNYGILEGMGQASGTTFMGIRLKGNNGICEYNTIINTGYLGIGLFDYYDNAKIRYNFIDGTCSILQDGGAIYCHFGTVGTNQAGIQIYNNIVLNSTANGLYTDGLANHIELFNNLVYHCSKWGLHMNEPVANSVHDNTFVDCTRSCINISNLYYKEVQASGNTISSNIMVQGNNSQYLFDLVDGRTYNIGNFGTSNSNTFVAESSDLNIFKTQVSQPGFRNTLYAFSTWQAFSGQETASTLTKADLKNIQCEYNNSKISQVQYLACPMVDVKGVKYPKSITLQPFTSAVLMKDPDAITILHDEYIAICQGTNYNGWTISGKYERTLVAKSGADSIVTTYLTVNPTYSISENVTIKEGAVYLSWNKTGQYVRTLTSISGCDSIITTNLKVLSPVVYTEYKSICDETSYKGWTTSGKYIQTFEAKSGADSIVTTYLTVNPVYSITENVTISEGETYNGWTTSGVYTRKLSSVYGCDSTITTNLTVNSLVIKQAQTTSHFVPVSQGQKYMNFIVVSAISEDIPLAPDDEIAVFSGTSCVGANKLLKTINSVDNSTNLNILAFQNDGSNNGFNNNDTIIFKIWDNVKQKEMQAKAVKYRSDETLWATSGKYLSGATAVVEIVSYSEYTQTIQLIKGNNLVSTYLIPTNPDMSVVMKSLCNDGALSKVSDEAGKTLEYWGNYGGWINKIGSIQKTEGYILRANRNCSMQITGRSIVLPLDIPLKAGWNIISYPRTDLVNAMSVVQSLIDQKKLIKVLDESGNSIENWAKYGGWKNNIGNFVPGKAYKINVSTDAVLTIQQSYTKSTVIQPRKEFTTYYQPAFDGNGTNHMNINLVGLQEMGVGIGDEIAAFDGNVCVGALKITASNLAQGSASLIASSSTDSKSMDGFNDGNAIQLYLWNSVTGNESEVKSETISGQMDYQGNNTVLINLKSLSTGTKNLENMLKIEVFPNPSVGKVTVRFSQIPDMGSRIEILDMSGRKVALRTITGLSEEFNLESQPAGLYLVKSILGSEELIQKLIINK